MFFETCSILVQQRVRVRHFVHQVKCANIYTDAKPARSAVSSSAPRGSASRSRSQTPAAPTSPPGSSPQRSFVDESNIFGAAGIDSSVVSSHEGPQIPDAVEDRMRADRAQLESLARERLSTAHTRRGHKYPKLTSFFRNAWYW